MNENGKRLCALYCRIGGVSEMDREMLEHQCWSLRNFAHEQGFEVAGIVKALESGLFTSRPSIDDLVDLCGRESVHYLVVDSLGRLCRSSGNCKKILRRLYDVGIRDVITKREGTIFLKGVFDKTLQEDQKITLT